MSRSAFFIAIVLLLSLSGFKSLDPIDGPDDLEIVDIETITEEGGKYIHFIVKIKNTSNVRNAATLSVRYADEVKTHAVDVPANGFIVISDYVYNERGVNLTYKLTATLE